MTTTGLDALVAEQQRWAASVASAKKRHLYDDPEERSYEQGYLDGLTVAVRLISQTITPPPVGRTP